MLKPEQMFKIGDRVKLTVSGRLGMGAKPGATGIVAGPGQHRDTMFIEWERHNDLAGIQADGGYCIERFELVRHEVAVAPEVSAVWVDESSHFPPLEVRSLPPENWMVIEGALCRIRDETLSTSELKLVTETLSRLRETKP